MSVNEKMTALAEAVRSVSHKKGKLTIDGMTSALSGVSNFSKSVIERTVTKITAEDLEGIEIIGEDLFRNHPTLTKVQLSDTVKALGHSAFNGCKNLTEFDFNNGGGTVGGWVLFGTAIEHLTVPDSVTWTSAETFSWCENLKNVIWNASNAPIWSGGFACCKSLEYIDFSQCNKVVLLNNISAFEGVPNTCKFYVPAALFDEWKAATNWSAFADQIMVKP